MVEWKWEKKIHIEEPSMKGGYYHHLLYDDNVVKKNEAEEKIKELEREKAEVYGYIRTALKVDCSRCSKKAHQWIVGMLDKHDPPKDTKEEN